jgi:hypothetical protein
MGNAYKKLSREILKVETTPGDVGIDGRRVNYYNVKRMY